MLIKNLSQQIVSLHILHFITAHFIFITAQIGYHCTLKLGMIRHSMDAVKLAVDSLNPRQVPLIAMDQPLFAVSKQIQWNWPDL